MNRCTGVTTLLLVCAAIFMLVLDTTVVVVALPAIQRDLNARLSGLQWVIDAYTVVLGSLLLTAATLGDRLGRARLFLIGICLFTGASLACALAPTALFLCLFRALQGVGGAVLFGVAVPLITDAFVAGRRRDIALGVFGAVSGSALALGPLLGGYLTATLGWRAIFWVNVPIGLLVLLSYRRGLVRVHGVRLGRPDVWGTVLLTIFLSSALVACIEGGRLGWNSPAILGCLVVALVAAGAFVRVELTTVHPMVDLGCSATGCTRWAR